jgi:hypothetical protein
MPYTTAHAPNPFDHFHDWAPATATAPPTLNDCNADPRELPQIVLTGAANWYGLAELTNNSVPRTTGVGAVFVPPRQSSKTMVYKGRVEADDRFDLIEAMTALGRGFADRDTEGTMTLTPWASVAGVGDDLIVWTYAALVADYAPDEAWVLTDGFYEWGFTLTMVMSDPYFRTEGATYP